MQRFGNSGTLLKKAGFVETLPRWNVESFWSAPHGANGSSYRNYRANSASQARDICKADLQASGYTLTGWGTIQRTN